MIEDVFEELEGAEHYLHEATTHRESHPEWANYYRDMAKQEMQHAERLMTMATAKYSERAKHLNEMMAKM